MENGMTISQWQYNTLLRNLLRRPEVHHYWEKRVADQVLPYNVPARFHWRPRNTKVLKWRLEYLDDVELRKEGDSLALQAYETGLEVRSTEELWDPSVLITEYITIQNPPGPSNPTIINNPENQFGVPISPNSGPEMESFPFLFHHSVPMLPSPSSNVNTEQFPGFNNFESQIDVQSLNLSDSTTYF